MTRKMCLYLLTEMLRRSQRVESHLSQVLYLLYKPSYRPLKGSMETYPNKQAKHKQINNNKNNNKKVLFPDCQPSNSTPRTFGREIGSSQFIKIKEGWKQKVSWQSVCYPLRKPRVQSSALSKAGMVWAYKFIIITRWSQENTVKSSSTQTEPPVLFVPWTSISYLMQYLYSQRIYIFQTLNYIILVIYKCLNLNSFY